MSFDIVIEAARARLPSPKDWQQAIDQAGFPLKIDTDFELEKFSGFLPCTFRGAQSGFEYSAQRCSDSVDAGSSPGRDFIVSLTAHGEHFEAACAVLAGAALCAVCDGILSELQGGDSVPAESSIAWARRWLATSDAESAGPFNGPASLAAKPGSQTFSLRHETARLAGKRVIHALIMVVLTVSVLQAGLVQGTWLWAIATFLGAACTVAWYRAYRALAMPFELTCRADGTLAWKCLRGQGSVAMATLRRIAPSPWDTGTLRVTGQSVILHLPESLAAHKDLWRALHAGNPRLTIDLPQRKSGRPGPQV